MEPNECVFVPLQRPERRPFKKLRTQWRQQSCPRCREASGRITDDEFTGVFGSISFFVNAGIKFIEESASCEQ